MAAFLLLLFYGGLRYMLDDRDSGINRGTGCPCDNAVAETTYNIFKTEFVFGNKFNSLDELKHGLDVCLFCVSSVSATAHYQIEANQYPISYNPRFRQQHLPIRNFY